MILDYEDLKVVEIVKHRLKGKNIMLIKNQAFREYFDGKLVEVRVEVNISELKK